MFSRQTLAVLSWFVLNALAHLELGAGGEGSNKEPRYGLDVVHSPSTQSTIIDVSAMVASTSLEYGPAFYTSSTVETTPLSFSTSTRLSSSPTSVTESTTPSTPSISSSSTTPSVASPTAAASTSISTSSTVDSRTQTITLAVCLGVLGLILFAIVFILFRRYRHSQSPFSPFSHRGASPIDDDEIATWRGNSQPMAKTPSSHVRNASSIVFQPYPGWKWNTACTSPTSPPGSGEAVPYPPPVVARAPNARSGLTDEAIPGAAPFVGPAQRHSRRLSKAPSAGHMRNKSRRSSISVASVRERPSTSGGQWAEPEEWDVQRKRSNSGSRTVKTAAGRTSMGDDVRPGGLSPRPIPAQNIHPPELPGSAY